MSYSELLVYDTDGEFVGYIINKTGTIKISGSNIYKEGEEAELQQQLGLLNQDVALKQHWPHAQDPDVLALTNDPNWEPLEYIDTEIIDEDNSVYVFKSGKTEFGEHIEAEDGIIDEEASILVYKPARVPKEPSAVMARIKKASEIVARQRAGIA